MLKRLTIALLLLVTSIAGCGRREERAWFDAPPPKELPSPAHQPLPQTAFQVRWSPVEFPSVVDAGAWIPANVTFTNAGSSVWYDNATADPQGGGSYAVRLGYTWLPAGTLGQYNRSEFRSNLAKPLAPGESATHQIAVQAPDKAGDYQLIIELVQEGVIWFADAGADSLVIPVRVRPRAASPASATSSPAALITTPVLNPGAR